MWARCQAHSLSPLLGKGAELQSLGVSLTELGDIDPSGPTPSGALGPTSPTSPMCLRNVKLYPPQWSRRKEETPSRIPPAV